MVSDSMNEKQLSGAGPLNNPMQSVGDITNDTTPEVTLSDTQAAGHLPAVLGTRDLTVLMLLIVLFAANIQAISLVFGSFAGNVTAYSALQVGTTVVWVCTIIQLFVLVLWLLSRRKGRADVSTRQHLLLLSMPLVGVAASLVGIWATVSSSWLSAISNGHWVILVLGVTFISLFVGGISSELLRLSALLSEQRRVNDREVALRACLQEAYNEQQILLQQQQEAYNEQQILLQQQQEAYNEQQILVQQQQEVYNEQQILLQQQQELLTEVDRLYKEQAQAAVTDAITGLPNRRAITSRIDEELAHCRRAGRSCAILFLDIDHFKRVNDTWGHRAGDAILREIGARLRIAQQFRKRVRSAVSISQGGRHYGQYTHPPNFLSNARSALHPEDFFGRYGGEEFAFILTDTGLGGARMVAERLRVAVARQPCFWEAEDCQSVVPISITVSIGIAVYQLHGVTSEALIESADRAMYCAKQSGRNCVRIAEVEEIEPLQEKQPVLDAKQSAHTSEVGIVRALAATASAHDQGTDAHAHRLLQLAEATARELGHSEEELRLIRLAALLHDIGKVGIPDALLHKPGPLTDEEWAIMRRHPQISCEILEQAGGIFRLLARIIVAHHERWDGRGYPAGLAQETIPIGARIISVVDSYDAMTSRRVYQESLTIEQAKEELRRCAGSQYDPQVVAAFLRILDEQEQGMLPAESAGSTTSGATEQEQVSPLQASSPQDELAAAGL